MGYQDSIWQNTKPARKARNYCRNELSYKETLKKRQMRKTIRKKQAAKTRFFIIFCLVFGVLMPVIFMNNINNLFLKKFRNSDIKVPTDVSYMSSAECLISDNVFMDTRYLDFVNTKNPVMNTPVLTREMPNLTRNLKNIMVKYPSLNPGIFIWDYSTGGYVDINADKIYPAASIIKIPILYQLYRRAEKGLVDLNSSMCLSGPFVSEGSGFLQYSPLGTTLTYRQLAELMIQQSDNTASNMLLATVGGMSELDRAIKYWGMGVTQLSNWLPDLEGTNITTPHEIGSMIYNIDNPDFLSLRSRSEIVEIMGHVRNRHLIQAGLPDYVQFLHKTGDIGTMQGDAGVVIFPNGRKYLIVIMVGRHWNDYSSKQFIIEASELTYKSISRGWY